MYIRVLTTAMLLSLSLSTFATSKFVVAHRGASGYLPEHTLPAKALAFAQGADYLEQDIVMTKDDQLLVLHGLTLDNVTDVATRFPKRAREDGHFYAIDFTLSELKTLQATTAFHYSDGKAVPEYSNRFPVFKSSFHLHTFQEEIEFIQGLNFSTGKNVGIFPEIKAPWFHMKEGKDITMKVLSVLKEYGYTTKEDNIYLQCFDANELKRIKTVLGPSLGMNVKLVQLIAYTNWGETQEKTNGKWVNYNYDWMLKPEGIKLIAQYADAISPYYGMLLHNKPGETSVTSNGITAIAHAEHIQVIPFYVLSDRLPKYAKNVNQLFQILYRNENVDGLFTDFPDKAVDYLKDTKQ
ncbi:glycerophosphodiester phosphodiesterase [Pseudocitrobacter faecalis]|uniref:glycerophosphodiester phosphodiesterase n=1 Tax=Pseudocitrobacter faecalis TaxID=1398493 RepID=UPI0039EF20EF